VVGEDKTQDDRNRPRLFGYACADGMETEAEIEHWRQTVEGYARGMGFVGTVHLYLERLPPSKRPKLGPVFFGLLRNARRGDVFIFPSVAAARLTFKRADALLGVAEARGLALHLADPGIDLTGRSVVATKLRQGFREVADCARRRAKAVAARLRREGRPGGRAPIGFSLVGREGAKRLEINRRAVAVMRVIVAMRDEGKAWSEITEHVRAVTRWKNWYLLCRPFQPGGGSPSHRWSPRTVRRSPLGRLRQRRRESERPENENVVPGGRTGGSSDGRINEQAVVRAAFEPGGERVTTR
jgi:DNA invertase Pin-like site-specific DNA recombinase